MCIVLLEMALSLTFSSLVDVPVFSDVMLRFLTLSK